MKNRSVLFLWALVFGNVLLQAESVLRITFIEDLCYNTKQSVIDLRYDASGILMSAPARNAPDSFECEVLLTPPKGASVVLSIFRYDLYDEDQLIIEDSDRHRIALMGWGSFKDEKKSIISDGRMSIQYKTSNKTSAHRRAGFQFTFTKVMKYPCSANEYKCDNGKCVLKDYICDGHNHCGDRSDQKKCGIDESAKTVPESKTNKSIIFVSLIIVGTIILFIVVVVFIVYVVKGIKLKKAIANKPNAPNPPANPQNTIPLQTVSSSVPRQAAQAPMTSVPRQAAQAPMTSVPVHGTQGNTFYNRVRRSLRGSRSQPNPENVPEQTRTESYQVPSMYPSLDIEPNAPEMYGIENSEFKIEE